MRALKAACVLMGLAAAAAMTACGSESTAAEASAPPVTSAPPVATSATTLDATAEATADVAAKIRVPDRHLPVSTMNASGVQVYECADGAWKLLEPAATLTEDGKAAALHSRGPVWVSTEDGSAVNATPVEGASVPRTNAVPELLLKATATRGAGVFEKVSYVQRLQTEGGVAPDESCTGEEQKAVPYTAVYTFYAPEK